jgi:hypothetical protein
MLVSISPFSDVRRLRQFFPICKDLSTSAGTRRCQQPLISINRLWLQQIERQGECIGRQCPDLQFLRVCPSSLDTTPAGPFALSRFLIPRTSKHRQGRILWIPRVQLRSATEQKGRPLTAGHCSAVLAGGAQSQPGNLTHHCSLGSRWRYDTFQLRLRSGGRSIALGCSRLR